MRTMTAFTTSPFLMAAVGRASLTEQTMMSPRPAYRRLEPPATWKHMRRRAPELSATLRIVRSCIIGLSRLRHDADEAPALEAREGPGLHDLDRVAGLRFVVLVVEIETAALGDGLLVERVLGPAHHVHG